MDEIKKIRGAIVEDNKELLKPLRDHLSIDQGIPEIPEIIALPSNRGLRFIDTNHIVLFRCITEGIPEKSSWEALLPDSTTLKLKANTTAERIIKLMNKNRFFQINQSCIINRNYLDLVEIKTRDCLLVPPFDNLKLTASRTHLTKLRDEFEVL